MSQDNNLDGSKDQNMISLSSFKMDSSYINQTQQIIQNSDILKKSQYYSNPVSIEKGSDVPINDPEQIQRLIQIVRQKNQSNQRIAQSLRNQKISDMVPIRLDKTKELQIAKYVKINSGSFRTKSQNQQNYIKETSFSQSQDQTQKRSIKAQIQEYEISGGNTLENITEIIPIENRPLVKKKIRAEITRSPKLSTQQQQMFQNNKEENQNILDRVMNSFYQPSQFSRRQYSQDNMPQTLRNRSSLPEPGLTTFSYQIQNDQIFTGTSQLSMYKINLPSQQSDEAKNNEEKSPFFSQNILKTSSQNAIFSKISSSFDKKLKQANFHKNQMIVGGSLIDNQSQKFDDELFQKDKIENNIKNIETESDQILQNNLKKKSLKIQTDVRMFNLSSFVQKRKQIYNPRQSTPLNQLNVTGKQVQYSQELKAGTNRFSRQSNFKRKLLEINLFSKQNHKANSPFTFYNDDLFSKVFDRKITSLSSIQLTNQTVSPINQQDYPMKNILKEKLNNYKTEQELLIHQIIQNLDENDQKINEFFLDNRLTQTEETQQHNSQTYINQSTKILEYPATTNSINTIQELISSPEELTRQNTNIINNLKSSIPSCSYITDLQTPKNLIETSREHFLYDKKQFKFQGNELINIQINEPRINLQQFPNLQNQKLENVQSDQNQQKQIGAQFLKQLEDDKLNMFLITGINSQQNNYKKKRKSKTKMMKPLKSLCIFGTKTPQAQPQEGHFSFRQPNKNLQINKHKFFSSDKICQKDEKNDLETHGELTTTQDIYIEDGQSHFESQIIQLGFIKGLINEKKKNKGNRLRIKTDKNNSIININIDDNLPQVSNKKNIDDNPPQVSNKKNTDDTTRQLPQSRVITQQSRYDVQQSNGNTQQKSEIDQCPRIQIFQSQQQPEIHHNVLRGMNYLNNQRKQLYLHSRQGMQKYFKKSYKNTEERSNISQSPRSPRSTENENKKLQNIFNISGSYQFKRNSVIENQMLQILNQNSSGRNDRITNANSETFNLNTQLQDTNYNNSPQDLSKKVSNEKFITPASTEPNVQLSVHSTIQGKDKHDQKKAKTQFQKVQLGFTQCQINLPIENKINPLKQPKKAKQKKIIKTTQPLQKDKLVHSLLNSQIQIEVAQIINKKLRDYSLLPEPHTHISSFSANCANQNNIIIPSQHIVVYDKTQKDVMYESQNSEDHSVIMDQLQPKGNLFNKRSNSMDQTYSSPNGSKRSKVFSRINCDGKSKTSFSTIGDGIQQQEISPDKKQSQENLQNKKQENKIDLSLRLNQFTPYDLEIQIQQQQYDLEINQENSQAKTVKKSLVGSTPRDYQITINSIQNSNFKSFDQKLNELCPPQTSNQQDFNTEESKMSHDRKIIQEHSRKIQVQSGIITKRQIEIDFNYLEKSDLFKDLMSSRRSTCLVSDLNVMPIAIHRRDLNVLKGPINSRNQFNALTQEQSDGIFLNNSQKDKINHFQVRQKKRDLTQFGRFVNNWNNMRNESQLNQNIEQPSLMSSTSLLNVKASERLAKASRLIQTQMAQGKKTKSIDEFKLCFQIHKKNKIQGDIHIQQLVDYKLKMSKLLASAAQMHINI